MSHDWETMDPAEHAEAVRVGDECIALLARLKPFQRAWALAVVISGLASQRGGATVFHQTQAILARFATS